MKQIDVIELMALLAVIFAVVWYCDPPTWACILGGVLAGTLLVHYQSHWRNRLPRER